MSGTMQTTALVEMMLRPYSFDLDFYCKMKHVTVYKKQEPHNYKLKLKKAKKFSSFTVFHPIKPRQKFTLSQTFQKGLIYAKFCVMFLPTQRVKICW